jgi:hypothetical protein
VGFQGVLLCLAFHPEPCQSSELDDPESELDEALLLESEVDDPCSVYVLFELLLSSWLLVK